MISDWALSEIVLKKRINLMRDLVLCVCVCAIENCFFIIYQFVGDIDGDRVVMGDG